MSKKNFYLKKNNSLKIIFISLFIIMLFFYIIQKDIYELFIMLLAVIAIFINVYCQRDILIEIYDKSMKVIKLPSKFLKRTEEEILFSDIIRINQTHTRSQSLVQIRRKYEPDVFIPLRLNTNFDRYIFELDTRLRNENPAYNDINIKKDTDAVKYERLAIASYILSCIIFACIIIFSSGFGLYELFLYCCAFIIPLIFIGLWIKHR